MQVYLLLTEECNLRCKMCIRGEKNKKRVDHDFLFRNDLVDFFFFFTVILTGGEPTIHPDFINIVNDLAETNDFIAVTTNGTLNYYFDKVKKNKIFFQVSIDGNEYWHNQIRGDGTYNMIMENIKFMDKNDFKYSIASVINRNNYKEIGDLIKELENLQNLQFWKLHYEMPFGCANYNNSLSCSEWNAFIDWVIKRAHFRVFATKLFPFDLYDKNKDKLEKEKTKRVLNCGCVTQKVYIYPDYTVYPCTCLTDFPLGNLKEDTLQSILENNNSKKFKCYTLRENSKCYNCNYKGFCNGGCIGMSYHYFGKLGMGDVRCPLIEKEDE